MPWALTAESEPVRRCRIPNTKITIGRVAEGPRRGEYLFTTAVGLGIVNLQIFQAFEEHEIQFSLPLRHCCWKHDDQPGLLDVNLSRNGDQPDSQLSDRSIPALISAVTVGAMASQASCDSWR